MKLLIFFIWILPLFFLLPSCAPNRKAVDDSVLAGKIKNLKDGVTTKFEVMDQFGYPRNSYEKGRIQIYLWNRDSPKIYHVVTIFSEDNILKRHSIVRVR